ncbi:MAG: radical SAM family heme chaperone HemW [Deltaproteobacteria bacterium]|nr:radical SAM family heme chaperone HemW [Deltaproteobacteria bacterium]
MIPFARFGVYLHFPYCLSKCPYCDFASQVEQVVPHRRYADAMLRELEQRAERFAGRTVETIYIGGGTPSLWEPACLADVLAAIRARFAVAPDAEITLEANPGASDAERFTAFRALGVNRLSIGMQSFDSKALTALGRTHSAREAERAFQAARDAGFTNLSLDLLYGSAGHGGETAAEDARHAVSLGPDHLSAYALTLEAQAVEVPMAKQLREGTLTLPDDDSTARMGEQVRDVLRDAGYARYEISNYARDGKSSRHNALYWKGGEYLALGCGATGYRQADGGPRNGGERYSNTRAAEGYMAALAEGRRAEKVEPLTGDDLFTERLMLGLRLTEGVDIAQICETFGRDPHELRKKAKRLVVGGWAAFEGDRLTLTERGLDVHTEAAVRLI